MELYCEKCDNSTEFIEETISKWKVDSQGRREEKIYEDTVFKCDKCGATITEE